MTQTIASFVLAEGDVYLKIMKEWLGDLQSFKDINLTNRKQITLCSSNIDIGRRSSTGPVYSQKYSRLVCILLHDVECVRLG